MRIIWMFLLVFCSVFSNVTAQHTTANQTPKCDGVVVRDKSHPAWKAIDAQYSKLAETIRKKDLDAMFALYAPDLHAVTPTGEVWDRERSLAYARGGYAQVKETALISNTILRLAVCGEKEATATVLQVWYRTQMMRGKLRLAQTTAVQDEQWVRLPEGWKRRKIDNVINGTTLIDGKRVDSNKPYDPDAPAYDPYDASPKQSIADALFPIITAKGIDAALAQYHILKQSGVYYVTEVQLNDLGYRLFHGKKVEESIEVFKLNVEEYPQSANVYDSLGEAYMTDGNKELAIKNYQKVLELSPQNANAIEMLKKLRGQ